MTDMLIQNDNQGDAAPQTGNMFEANTQNFEDKVMRASMEKPVIAYFTAPWCGPCRTLGPILEKTVAAVGDALSMAKIDLDSNQELAAALRIQSVPTIFAFFQGQPIDAFQGAVPESQVKQFIDKVMQIAKNAAPDAIDIDDVLTQAASAAQGGELALAQQLYVQVLQQDDKHPKAYGGLMKLMVTAGELEAAQEMQANIPQEIANDPAICEAIAALELAAQPVIDDFSALEAKIAQNSKDHESRIALADALFAANRKEEACEHLLQAIDIDREWSEAAARQQLLKYFEAMGHGDPVTVSMRKKLSSILFS